MTYDIGIIGGGPGGYVAAIKAAQSGAKTVLFEEHNLGGTCLNRGCIPTKALLKSANLYKQISHASAFGINVDGISVDFGAVMKRKETVVKQLVGGISSLMKKNGVKVVSSRAELLGRNTILAGGESYECTNIILATGSKPAKLPIPGIEHAYNSDHVLSMEQLPQSIAIIGGGVIGVEFAVMLNAFGCKVTVIEMLPHLIAMADDMIIEQVEKQFKRSGISVITGAAVNEIYADGLSYQDADGIHRIFADHTVVATGRVPNVDTAMLDKLGIKHDRGRITTDLHMRTNVPGIYAIGDVNGKSMLAHTASREAVIAVNNILCHTELMDYNIIPSCVYSTPEIAWVGLNERDAKKLGINYKTGTFPVMANGKSLIEGESEGMLKIIADAATEEILGGHLVCCHATDMIAEIAALMNVEATVEDICSTVHPHPTVSESIMEAAEAVFGKSVHF